MSNRTHIDGILQQVQTWPSDDRAALAREILRVNHRSTSLAPAPRDTLKRAMGVLRTNAPAPSDEQVKRIIEEARLAKYGR